MYLERYKDYYNLVVYDETTPSAASIPADAQVWDDKAKIISFLGYQDYCRAFWWRTPRILEMAHTQANLVMGASNWDDAITKIIDACTSIKRNGKPLGVIQFWGHGMPGVPMMGEHRLSYPAFKDNSSSLYARLCQMRDLISPATYLWFRCSSFFSGEMGRNAVEHFTNFFRCKLVGHTHKIGFIQSGCYVVDIKDKPRWPVTDAAQSFFYEPNTILATNFFPCVE